MNKKVIARACSNVALLKYWGREDNILRLPANNSISVNLSGLVTKTTITRAEKDEVVIDGQKGTGSIYKRVVDFLDLAGGKDRVRCRVISRNSFPKSTGMSSSASGFAALAGAANEFFGLGLDERRLSILARKGSGSACRSIPGGWVRWKTGKKDADSYAETIFDKDYWDLRVLAVVVSDEVKGVATSKGHELAKTSSYFEARLKVIEEREEEMMEVIGKKDFGRLVELVEREMFEFHAIPMTSKPPLFYWYPGTVAVIHKMGQMRKKGVPVFCTVNTGHNAFVFVEPGCKQEVEDELKKMEVVTDVVENRVGGGVEVIG